MRLPLAFAAAAALAAGGNEISPSPLERELASFVAEHPEAPLKDVVARASKRLGEVGMNFYFDVRGGKLADKLTFMADGKALTAEIADEGECGEAYLTLPAAGVSGDSIGLVRRGKSVAVARPKSLRLESVQVLAMDMKTVIADVQLPIGSIPHGITPDGRLLLRLSLGREGAAWWSRRQAESKFFEGAEPYLLYEMDGGRPRFVDDESKYAGQLEPVRNAPTDSANGYLRYGKFKGSHFILKYSEPCT